MSDVTIYHNPARHLPQHPGHDPQRRNRAAGRAVPGNPALARATEGAVQARRRRRARRAARKGTPYAELGLDNPALDDEALLDAIEAHPILLNRPFVSTPLGARLCRPSELVLDILPAPQQGAFTKEDGEAVIDAQGKRIQK